MSIIILSRVYLGVSQSRSRGNHTFYLTQKLGLCFANLGIHDLVSTTNYDRFHGSSGAPVDFGEAPSQMLENWSWDVSLLQRLSKPFSSISTEYFELWKKLSNGEQQPPETLPHAVIDGLIRERRIGAGLRALH